MEGNQPQKARRVKDMYVHPEDTTDTCGGATGDPVTRDAKQSILRGWRRKCPHCGNGPLLKSYLKVNDTCAVCREELYHHRADDGPAYLTILLVGHLMAPLLHVSFVMWRPEPLTLFTIFAVGCVGLSLYLLPRLKGAIVGYQWARRMGGFGTAA